MSKYTELNGLNLNGFKPYFMQTVINDKGLKEPLFFLSKGNYSEGFKDIKGLLSEVAFLCSNELTNTKPYKLADSNEIVDGIL